LITTTLLSLRGEGGGRRDATTANHIAPKEADLILLDIHDRQPFLPFISLLSPHFLSQELKNYAEERKDKETSLLHSIPEGLKLSPMCPKESS
jgi:hypothetical protein